MRVAVLGGTGFIGGAIVAEVAAAGHDVLVIHRGQREPEGQPAVEHAHVERHDVSQLASALHQFGAEALIDGIALSARDADDALAAASNGLRLLVLSSVDVYRAFGALNAGTVADDGPLDEHAPVRAERYPYRGQIEGMDEYEKLDVEERYLARTATVIRLPIVYGERDPQRREEPVLRRIRAGRPQLPVGAGAWRCGRGYVGEMARGVRLALEADTARGEIFNLAETPTSTMRAWVEQIVVATGATIELVEVPDDALPPDLGSTGTIQQQIVVDSTKAARLLGWTHADPMLGVRRSVRWHLAHPPAQASDDFSEDARALKADG
jgi:UDP-glucose 4-epimerase